MGWTKRLQKAKRLHRPSLKDWECDALYQDFPSFVKNLLQQEQKSKHPEEQQLHFDSLGTLPALTNNTNSTNDNNHQPTTTTVTTSSSTCAKKDILEEDASLPSHPHLFLPVVLDARTIAPPEFWSRYEATNTPCLIRNIPAGYNGGGSSCGNCSSAGGSETQEEWPAVQKWTLENLERSELREKAFKCGEDNDGHSIKIKLKYFLRYLHANRDDSPLYIFDTSLFENDRLAKSILLNDYRVPLYFKDDLFRFVSESRRPPYRWFLVGPERSGSTVHVDPLATNAWNTLLHGTKRWVLFPPHVPKSVVKGRGLIRSDEDDEAIHYFMTILPRIKRKAAAAQNQGDYTNFAVYEFTQHARETVFVPHGWWHAVLNLTHTVGVTQNFCSPRNFDAVWCQTRKSRQRLAWKWLNQLEQNADYAHLATRARALNQRDHFRMKYDPEEIKRREGEKRRQKMKRWV